MSNSSVPQFGLTTEQLLTDLKRRDKSDAKRAATPPSTPASVPKMSPQAPQTPSRVAIAAALPSTGKPRILLPGRRPQTTRRDNTWKAQAEVGVRIEGLPEGVTTLDLYRCFKREGTISRIQVPVRPRGPSFINFSPPPKRAFWAGEGPPIILAASPGLSARKLNCQLTQQKGSQVPSPIRLDVFYDESMTLELDTFDFGFMQGVDCFVVKRSAAPQRARDLQLSLNLRFRKLQIDFTLPKQQQQQQQQSSRASDATGISSELITHYRFEVPIKELRRIDCIQSADDQQELVFSLQTPPEYYFQTPNVEATHDPMSTEWCSWFAWFRMTDLVHNPKELRTQPLSLRRHDPIIDLGRWTTYRMRLSHNSSSREQFDIFRQALEDHNVLFTDLDNLECRQGSNEDVVVWDLIDPPVHADHKSSLTSLDSNLIVLPFAIRYQLEVCLSRGVISEHNITVEFLQAMLDLGPRAVTVLEAAALQHSATSDPYFDPASILKLAPTKPPRATQGGHTTYIRAAQVTPTSVYYTTPVLETSNRVIRHFFAYEDRFLRVRFGDERGKVRFKEHDINEEIYLRVKRVLNQGLRIGDRHYEFLAFGNSQFRENSAYFFASTDNLKASEIRTWMGDLRGIKTIAKWAARLGQSFSTTRSINSARVKVNTEMDITRNEYNFSDGVGKISPFLAQLVALEFGIKAVEGACPSLFQFRMGGCKGVLAVDPALAGPQAQEVVIRESQYKFPAGHEGLDVIRYSSFAASMLNRQLIIVLHTLGVPTATFLNKQERELAELERAMHDEALALKLLQKRIDFNQMTLTVASLILDGFMKSKEPFVVSLIHLWRAWNVKYLKEKARITIDQGAFLLGCVDETGTLRGHYEGETGWHEAYGSDRASWIPEIFVQIQDPPHTGPYKVKTGLCLLARNPSLHPGDVRVVKAVDVPALHHLRDVVVFPQTGDRDLGNMCSGGDLDGDDYIVMWDQELFPPADGQNRKAMNFKPPTGTKLNRDVNIDDVRDFFVEYMKNNRLEVIAVSHLAQADMSPDGVDSYRCIELAELHSCAVDYPKSGQPAILDRRLIPRKWPHFMEKDPKVSYQSTSVLGLLYNQVQLVDFSPLYELKPDDRILKAYDWTGGIMLDIMQQVKEIKQEYDNSVRRIMAKHSIGTEFEVWSTFVLNHSRDMGDYKFHEEIGNLAESLKTQYKDEIITLAGGSRFHQLEPWVAAMYKVTNEEMAVAISECRQTITIDEYERPKRLMQPGEMPLMSFPWIFYHELGKIAMGGTRAGVSVGLHPVAAVKAPNITAAPNVVDTANKQDTLIPDVEAPSGKVVHPGEELKLFEDESSLSSPSELVAPVPTNAMSATSSQHSDRSTDDRCKEKDCSSVKGDIISISGSSVAESADSSQWHDAEQGSSEKEDAPQGQRPQEGQIVRMSALDRLAKLIF